LTVEQTCCGVIARADYFGMNCVAYAGCFIRRGSSKLALANIVIGIQYW
jgi:hypothetical protein